MNTFLDALPGPAIETRLYVITGRPRMFQEAVAYATKIDKIRQATTMKPSNRGQARRIEADNCMAGISWELCQGNGEARAEVGWFDVEVWQATADG